MDRNYGIIFFFQKIFILRRPGVVSFADIIKIVTMFIKAILKDSIKGRRIRNYASTTPVYMESISVVLDIAKFTDFQ